MKVWVIQVGEPLPIDPGTPRLWRSGLLAEHLAARGHDVVWWGSTFVHRTKRHRHAADVGVSLGPRLELFMLHSPGYRRNVSLGRLRDHAVLGRRFRDLAEARPRPDVIHCGFPTIELAVEAARYGARHDVPVVLDARDLWPDIFVDAVPGPLRFLARLALRSQRARTSEAFRLARAISGHTPGFVEFGLRHAGRAAGDLDRAFPFGYPVNRPTDAQIATASAFWESHGLSLDGRTPIVCFLGSFGVQRALDLMTPIHAARILHERGTAVRFVLCGSGPRLDLCRSLAQDLPNVLLPGWVGYPETWTLLRRSTLGLLPYLPARDFALSMPNKSVEYLAGSLPVLTSLTGGHLEHVLSTNRCGVFYRGADPAGLAACVEDLLGQPERIAEMGTRAGRLFDSDYSADVVYRRMAEHLEMVAGVQPATRAKACAL